MTQGTTRCRGSRRGAGLAYVNTLMIPPRIHLIGFFAFSVALAIQPACKSTPVAARTSKVPTGPATLAQARTYLEGKWTLVSMDVFPPDAQPIRGAATGTMV